MRKSLIISQLIFVLLFPVWLELTNYLHWIVIAVVWLCYTLSAIFFICLFKQITFFFSRKLLRIAGVLYSFSLVVLLFMRPSQQHYESYNLVPFETMTFYFSGEVGFLVAFYNLAANIGLFIPFGLYYRYMTSNPSAGRLLVYTILSISLIESSQFITHRGSLDIDDLLLNAAGVLLGFMLFPVSQKVFILK
jgi:hypothetical protein